MLEIVVWVEIVLFGITFTCVSCWENFELNFSLYITVRFFFFFNIHIKITGASGPTAATTAEQRRRQAGGWHFLPSKLLFLAGLLLDVVAVEAKPVQDMVQLLFSLVFPLSRSICCNSKWNISATDWKREGFVWLHCKKIFLCYKPHFVSQMSLKIALSKIRLIFVLPRSKLPAPGANRFCSQRGLPERWNGTSH